MKTTFGRVSRHGAMPLSQSLDTVGPLTRTVADNALMLAAIAGYDERDPSSTMEQVPDYLSSLEVPVNGLRIGRPRGYFDAALTPEVAAVMDAAYEVYRHLGCEIVDVAMPDLDAVNAIGFFLTWGDVIATHGKWMRECPDDYTPQTRGRIQMTLAASTQAYGDAQRLRGPLLREFCDSVFTQCDALLAPVLSIPVPQLAEVEKTLQGKDPTMRQLMELHRSKAMCSACHARMDPLGLGLENFNALGMWRTKENGQPIDVGGRLITGETFDGLGELKKILKTDRRQDFYRCLSEKLLTYALGRGLEYYDVATVDGIVQRLERDEGRFAALLTGVVESVPFQKRRNRPVAVNNDRQQSRGAK